METTIFYGKILLFQITKEYKSMKTVPINNNFNYLNKLISITKIVPTNNKILEIKFQIKYFI